MTRYPNRVARMIPIADIVEEHAAPRVVDAANVKRLSDSMKEIGLQTPIVVVTVRFEKDTRGHMDRAIYSVISGRHRFQAAKLLGWQEIECLEFNRSQFIENLPEDAQLHLWQELWSIDENLMRTDLTEGEMAVQSTRRKQIYETLHPETKLGENQHTRVRQFGEPTAERFTKATADATGKSERAIQRAVQRGEALGDDAALVIGTSLDKGVELDALAKMDEAERRPLIERAASGERVTARSKIDADVKVRAAREVASIIAEHVPGDWWDAVKSNLYAAGAANIANELTNITGQSIMDRRYGS